jgi:hypothetical protein
MLLLALTRGRLGTTEMPEMWASIGWFPRHHYQASICLAAITHAADATALPAPYQRLGGELHDSEIHSAPRISHNLTAGFQTPVGIPTCPSCARLQGLVPAMLAIVTHCKVLRYEERLIRPIFVPFLSSRVITQPELLYGYQRHRTFSCDIQPCHSTGPHS